MLVCDSMYFKEHPAICQFSMLFAMSPEQFSGSKHVLYTTCNSPASITRLALTQRLSQLQANFNLTFAMRDLSPAFMKEGRLRMGSKCGWRPHCKAEQSDVEIGR